jgi:hypothetical protein
VLRLAFCPAIALVARLLDLPESDEAVKIRTFTILGQAMVFKKRTTKMGACPALGWAELDDKQIRTIATILREQTEAILRAATEKKS